MLSLKLKTESAKPKLKIKKLLTLSFSFALLALNFQLTSCSDSPGTDITCQWGECGSGGGPVLDEGDKLDDGNDEDNNGDTAGDEEETGELLTVPLIPKPPLPKISNPDVPIIPKPIPEPEPDPEPEPEPEGDGTYLGSYKWTYYWLVFESDYTGQKNTPIKNMNCEDIAKARQKFVEDLSMEGSGYLEDGRLINEEDECTCGAYGICFFVVPDSSGCVYGKGNNDNCLRPFRTVASDMAVLPFGTKLYLPILDGLNMPGEEGFLHDGCVKVEDSGVSGKHLDFFSVKEPYYEILDNDLLGNADYVDVYKDSPKCE